jgi:hypothetical protein
VSERKGKREKGVAQVRISECPVYEDVGVGRSEDRSERDVACKKASRVPVRGPGNSDEKKNPSRRSGHRLFRLFVLPIRKNRPRLALFKLLLLLRGTGDLSSKKYANTTDSQPR